MIRTYVKQFVFFDGFIALDGWAFDAANPILSMALRVGDRVLPLSRYEHPIAPDHLAGFLLRQVVPHLDAGNFRDPVLEFHHLDRQTSVLRDIGIVELGRDHGMNSFNRFMTMVQALPGGNFLEIGGRARSGNTYKEKLEGWTYTSLDILSGDNVDVVGDAHKMSQLLPQAHFHAAMSISTFEHLLMPWKVAVELNKVLVVGGIAFIMTHQLWPLHERPWDYWRVSSDAWPALFNHYTGFRIIEAAMGQPLYAVANYWNQIANFQQFAGMAVSTVLVEKIGEAMVDWPVELAEIIDTSYPG